MSTMNVLDAAGLTVAVEKPLVPGQALMAASRPVVLASDHSAITVTGTITANVGTGTQPVSGTITANAGTGTFAISAASLPLPSGAATAAKQPALGTAGAAATDVLTVQGIASMTALKVDGSAVTQPISGSLTNISGTVSLPTGASTAANQSSIITAITSTNTKLDTLHADIIDTTPSSVKIDQTTDLTTNKVSVGNSPAGNTQKAYTGSFVVAGATLTRPANTTAYSVGDSISNSATAASVTALTSNNLSDTNDHPINLAEITLDTNDTGPGTAGATIRAHLYNSDPTASSGVIGGDNAAWSNKKAGWIGSFSGSMTLFSDGSKGVLVPDAGTLRMIAPASGAKNIWLQYQTLTAFNPSANSTTFTPTFKGFQARPA